MNAQRNRLLELALRGLEVEQERINNEIESIQRELRRGRGTISAPLLATAESGSTRRKPKFSPAERRRRAERMHQYWADRRAGLKAASASTMIRRKPSFSAEERKRRSERMRKYWAKRRAKKQ